MMVFWMFDVSSLIAKLVGPRPKVIWHAEFGNTSLATVDACDHMPIMRLSNPPGGWYPDPNNGTLLRFAKPAPWQPWRYVGGGHER
jgi:hypothetical protein